MATCSACGKVYIEKACPICRPQVATPSESNAISGSGILPNLAEVRPLSPRPQAVFAAAEQAHAASPERLDEPSFMLTGFSDIHSRGKQSLDMDLIGLPANCDISDIEEIKLISDDNAFNATASLKKASRISAGIRLPVTLITAANLQHGTYDLDIVIRLKSKQGVLRLFEGTARRLPVLDTEQIRLMQGGPVHLENNYNVSGNSLGDFRHAHLASKGAGNPLAPSHSTRSFSGPLIEGTLAEQERVRRTAEAIERQQQEEAARAAAAEKAAHKAQEDAEVQKDNSLWQEALQQDTEQAYRDYLNKNNRLAYKQSAAERIAALKEIEVERKASERKAEESRAAEKALKAAQEVKAEQERVRRAAEEIEQRKKEDAAQAAAELKAKEEAEALEDARYRQQLRREREAQAAAEKAARNAKEEAEEREEVSLWQAARRQDTEQAYRDYLAKSSRLTYKQSALEKITALGEKAKQEKSQKKLIEFDEGSYPSFPMDRTEWDVCPLRNFLVKEHGLDHIPKEEQSEIISKIGEAILIAQFIGIYEKIPENKRKEFDRIWDEEFGKVFREINKKRIQNFLEKNVPDYLTIMKYEMVNVIESILELEDEKPRELQSFQKLKMGGEARQMQARSAAKKIGWQKRADANNLISLITGIIIIGFFAVSVLWIVWGVIDFLWESNSALKKEAMSVSTSTVPSVAIESYVLRVGSFTNADDANKLKAKLATLGFEANVQTTTIPSKGVWHRVNLGPYKSDDEMVKTRGRLKQYRIDSTPMRLPQ